MCYRHIPTLDVCFGFFPLGFCSFVVGGGVVVPLFPSSSFVLFNERRAGDVKKLQIRHGQNSLEDFSHDGKKTTKI